MEEYKETMQKASEVQSFLADFFEFCDCNADEDGVKPLTDSIINYQEFYKAQKEKLAEEVFYDVETASEQLTDLQKDYALFIKEPTPSNYLELTKSLLNYQEFYAWREDISS